MQNSFFREWQNLLLKYADILLISRNCTQLFVKLAKISARHFQLYNLDTVDVISVYMYHYRHLINKTSQKHILFQCVTEGAKLSCQKVG